MKLFPFHQNHGIRDCSLLRNDRDRVGFAKITISRRLRVSASRFGHHFGGQLASIIEEILESLQTFRIVVSGSFLAFSDLEIEFHLGE